MSEPTTNNNQWLSNYYNYEEAITDGSQAMHHDGWDVQDAHAATSPYTEFGKVVAGLVRKFSGAEPLANDIFWALEQHRPQVAPVVPLAPAYEAHGQMMTELLGTEEYKQIHQSTAGDTYLSRIAAVGTLREAINNLPPEVLDRMNRLARLQEMETEADDQASTLEEIAEIMRQRGNLQRAEELLEMARKLRKMEMECKTAIAGDQTALSEDELDAFRRGAMAGMQGIQAQVQSQAAGISMYSTMMNMDGPGGGTKSGKSGMDTEDKIKLATRLMNSDKLRILAEMAGRFIEIAIRTQYAKLRQFQSEVVDIKTGNNIPRMLPAELSYLAGHHPALMKRWMKAFAEEELLEYEIESKEPKGRGPLIIAIDDSGSMDGDPELWSKAVALALLRIAQRQKRDAVIMHFTTSVDRVDEFPKGKAKNMADLLDTLEYFSGGGTAFEPWMSASLERVQKSKWTEADVICITDGLAYVSDEVEAQWNAARANLGMRVYCVLISDYDNADGAKQMARLCDSLMPISPSQTRVDGAGEDGDILSTVFSV